MNADEFWETSAGFLKSVVLQLFPRNIAKVISIWMSKVEQNSTAFKKYTDCFSVFHLDVPCSNLQELFRMVLVNFMTFLVLKILGNLASMKNYLNANNCEISKTVQRKLIFILNAFWESSTHFTKLTIVLAKKNIGIFT